MADLLTAEKAITVQEGNTTQSIRLFRNSSFFIMEEEGGLFIGDAAGSGIRMKNGRVSIEGAVSVELLPGRDLIAKAPRNMILQAQERVEITSSRGSIAMKAEENCHVLSGNGGTGSTVLENKALADNWNDVTKKQINAGDRIAGGIVIKSTGGGALSLMAQDMYMGGVSAKSLNPDGTSKSLSPNGTDATMNLTINGGRQGVVAIQAGYSYLMGYEIAALANAQQLAGIFVDPQQTIHVNNEHVLAGESVSIDKMSPTNVRVPRIDAGGLVNQRLSRSFNRTQLVVQGDVAADGNALISNNVLVGGGVSSKKGINSQLALTGSQATRFKVPVPGSSQDAVSRKVKDTYKPAVANMDSLLGRGVATDYGHAAASVAFPDSEDGYNLKDDYFVYAARWQTLLEKGGNWQENVIGHGIVGDTLPYPGSKVYKRRDAYVTVTSGGKLEKKKLSEYITNRAT